MSTPTELDDDDLIDVMPPMDDDVPPDGMPVYVEPLSSLQTGDIPDAISEVFTLTNAMRWRDGVLEQAWLGDRGNVEWHPVPTVRVP